MADYHFHFVDNRLDAEIYQQLHRSVNFKDYDCDDVTQALDYTLYNTVLFDRNEPIGCARIVGDNRIVFFIKDVIVHPHYQHQGCGLNIMNRVMEYISRHACDGAYVALMSTPGREPFYEKLGFIRRPSEELGSGMTLFYEQR